MWRSLCMHFTELLTWCGLWEEVVVRLGISMSQDIDPSAKPLANKLFWTHAKIWHPEEHITQEHTGGKSDRRRIASRDVRQCHYDGQKIWKKLSNDRLDSFKKKVLGSPVAAAIARMWSFRPHHMRWGYLFPFLLSLLLIFWCPFEWGWADPRAILVKKKSLF